MGSLDGKYAVVTGGASGIGRACVTALAAEGATVAALDLEPVADPAAALILTVDVSDAGSVNSAFDRIRADWGRLDCAVNCAGVEGPRAKTADYDADAFGRVLAVNLYGAFLCMRAELRTMLAGDGGSIVNMASAAGLVGVPAMPAYAASKGGLVQLTKSAAVDHAPDGIRVNVVCPGSVRTPMMDRIRGDGDKFASPVPLGRTAAPAEITGAVLYLCSDASSYVTGHALSVDGGYVAQ